MINVHNGAMILEQLVEKASDHHQVDSHPATVAYNVTMNHEWDELGDVLDVIYTLEGEIPPEFTEYIEDEAERVDGPDSLVHLVAMARRGAEQHVYEAVADNDD